MVEPPIDIDSTSEIVANDSVFMMFTSGASLYLHVCHFYFRHLLVLPHVQNVSEGISYSAL